MDHDKIQKCYGYQSYSLATNTLPVSVIQSVFSLLPLGRHLWSITTLNRYQPTDSSEILFTTTSRNVTIVRCRMSLATILLWILSWFTEFAEFSESHLGKTEMRIELFATFISASSHDFLIYNIKDLAFDWGLDMGLVTPLFTMQRPHCLKSIHYLLSHGTNKKEDSISKFMFLKIIQSLSKLYLTLHLMLGLLSWTSSSGTLFLRNHSPSVFNFYIVTLIPYLWI